MKFILVDKRMYFSAPSPYFLMIRNNDLDYPSHDYEGDDINLPDLPFARFWDWTPF